MMEYGVYTKIFRHFWQFSLIFNLCNRQMKQAKFKINGLDNLQILPNYPEEHLSNQHYLSDGDLLHSDNG